MSEGHTIALQPRQQSKTPSQNKQTNKTKDSRPGVVAYPFTGHRGSRLYSQAWEAEAGGSPEVMFA